MRCRRYRTRLCYFGERCNRSTCFFAHNISELRAAPGEGGPPQEIYHATATELAAAIPAPQQLPPDHLHSLTLQQRSLNQQLQQQQQQLGALPQQQQQQLGALPQQQQQQQQQHNPMAPSAPAVAASNGGSLSSSSIPGRSSGPSGSRHVPQIQAVPTAPPAEVIRQHHETMAGIAPSDQLQPSHHRHISGSSSAHPSRNGGGSQPSHVHTPGGGNGPLGHASPLGAGVRHPPPHPMMMVMMMQGQHSHTGRGPPGEAHTGAGAAQPLPAAGGYHHASPGADADRHRRPLPPQAGPPPSWGMRSGVDQQQQQQQNAYGGAPAYGPSQQQHMPLDAHAEGGNGVCGRYQQQQQQQRSQHLSDRDPGNSNRLPGWAAAANAEYQLACRATAGSPYQQQQQQQGFDHSSSEYHMHNRSRGGGVTPYGSQQQQQQQQVMYRGTSSGGYCGDIGGGGRLDAEAQWQLQQQQVHYQQQQQQRQHYSPRAGGDAYAFQQLQQQQQQHYRQQNQLLHRRPSKLSAGVADASSFPGQVAAAVAAVAAQQQAQIQDPSDGDSLLAPSASAASVSAALAQQQVQLQSEMQQLQLQSDLQQQLQSDLSSPLQPGQTRPQEFSLMQSQLARESTNMDDATLEARRFQAHARRYVSMSGNTFLGGIPPADYDSGLGYSSGRSVSLSGNTFFGCMPVAAQEAQQNGPSDVYSYGIDGGMTLPGLSDNGLNLGGGSGSRDDLLPDLAAATAAVMTRGLDAQQCADMLSSLACSSSAGVGQGGMLMTSGTSNATHGGPRRVSYAGVGDGMGGHASSYNHNHNHSHNGGSYSLSQSGNNRMTVQQQQAMSLQWQQQSSSSSVLSQSNDGGLDASLLQMLLGLGLNPFDQDIPLLPNRHSDPGQLSGCSSMPSGAPPDTPGVGYDPSLFMNRISDPSGGSGPAPTVDPLLTELLLALRGLSGSGNGAQQQQQQQQQQYQGGVEGVEQRFRSLEEGAEGAGPEQLQQGAAAPLTTPGARGSLSGVGAPTPRNAAEQQAVTDAGGTPPTPHTAPTTSAPEAAFAGHGGDAGGVGGTSVGAANDALGHSLPAQPQPPLASCSSSSPSCTSATCFPGTSSSTTAVPASASSDPAPSSGLVRTVSGAAMAAKLEAFVRLTLLPQLRDAGLADPSGGAVANHSPDIATAIGKLLQQLLPSKGAPGAPAAATASPAAQAGRRSVSGALEDAVSAEASPAAQRSDQ
ncbi:MAG: hypothetical protein WDW36_009097 [Sanguina aurantia]